MALPLISIVVPNFNHGKFLRDRLESIYNQTYENLEVILLDDKSSDNSREILHQYIKHPKTTYCVLNEENSGSTFSQWNKGIGLVSGDYVWIAESDDVCEHSMLDELIKPHILNKNVGLSFCQSNRLDSKNNITGSWLNHTVDLPDNKKWQGDFIMDGNKFIENFLIYKNVIPNVSAVLFNRKKLLEYVPLEILPYMKYYADWYFYIQILSKSKVAFISTPLNHFRYHEKSVIAKASGESGWIRIFKMEIQGRKKMIEYLESQNLENISAIRDKSTIGENKLIYLTAEGYINRGNILKAMYVIWNKPGLWKKTGNFLIRKLRK